MCPLCSPSSKPGALFWVLSCLAAGKRLALSRRDQLDLKNAAAACTNGEQLGSDFLKMKLLFHVHISQIHRREHYLDFHNHRQRRKR